VLDDVVTADRRHRDTTGHALGLWQKHWPDDPLTTIPGLGPICASTIRSWWRDATHLASAEGTVAHAGLNPSVWEPGLTEAPSRPITKQGSAELRLVLCQAVNVARRREPQLAGHYRRLRPNVATTTCRPTPPLPRKLACRAWVIATTDQICQPRDLDGNPISLTDATARGVEVAVPDRVRTRRRGHVRKGRLNLT
jgi:hypothetical protein